MRKRLIEQWTSDRIGSQQREPRISNLESIPDAIRAMDVLHGLLSRLTDVAEIEAINSCLSGLHSRLPESKRGDVHTILARYGLPPMSDPAAMEARGRRDHATRQRMLASGITGGVEWPNASLTDDERRVLTAIVWLETLRQPHFGQPFQVPEQYY